ncbi:hypothetical protein OsJ_25093 [Oryza sativa Japonica Group]|uniref:Uncharacterized protein n=1 Tax=Oryza sativa subsp. japonica TaxID=39947 RepID=B9FYD5_ORYSJ|nr:hypothetical protein OsJ_25093 [Oryza sativa Japonica Group]
MARLGLAVCAVSFHLCLLLSSTSSLRLNPTTEDTANHGRRTAYHFQPAKNWQNEQSNSGSNFEGMSVKQLIFGGKPSFEELVCHTKDVLGWSNQSIAIQGRYDVGAGPISHKYMLDLNGELEWNTYVDIVLGSQFKSLEVVASKLDPFDDEEAMKSQSVKSLTVEEVIESQGMGVDVNMQKKEAVDAKEGRSQESERVEINVELQKEEAVEANKASKLESEGVEVNVELQKEEAIEVNEARSQAVPIVGNHVDDDNEVADGSMGGGREERTTDAQLASLVRFCFRDKIYTRRECEETLLMNGLSVDLLHEHSEEYDDTHEEEGYEVEYAVDSDDDRPVAKISQEEREVFEKLVGCNPEVVQFEDVNNSELAVVDGGVTYNGIIDAMGEDIIVHIIFKLSLRHCLLKF